jgi:DNA replication and repair protein RecF
VRLLELTLSNFRNYEEASIACEDFNLIVGPNAQGKTNLLEAILVVATTKSHRASGDDELVRHAADHFYVCTDVQAEAIRRRIEVAHVAGGRKQVKLDGKVQRRFSNVLGQVKVVFFSPESLSLVKGGPDDRRRFLDMLVSQVRADYLQALQTYQNALRQRNALLRQIREAQSSSTLLDVWDVQLVEAGTALTMLRRAASQELRPILRRQQEYLTRGAETCDLEYSPGVPWGGEVQALRDGFATALRDARDGDIARGGTSVGPQRDDLFLTVGGMEARRFASQGQQRTLTLALKLSELEWIQTTSGDTPLFLLDDVTSELDEMRTALLFERLHELPPQVFMTTTRRELAPRGRSAPAVWEVRAGTLKRVE